jgi:hypothetical protein
MHLVIWILALIVLALWTATAWATHALLSIDPAAIGGLKGLIEQVPFAAWLDTWLPGWEAVLAGSVDVAQMLLHAAGGVGLWIVWILWGLVAFVIVAGAALLSLLVVLMKKAAATVQPPARTA